MRRRAGIVVVVVALCLGVTGVVLGGIALAQSGNRPSSASVDSELAGVDYQLNTLRSEITDLQNSVSTKTGANDPLEPKVARVIACLPELMSYINGIQPQVNNGQVSFSYGQQVSSYCSGLLYAGH